MGRTVAAVIVGYLFFMVAIFCVFTGLYLLMGTERVFEAGIYKPTMIWLAAMLVVSFIIGMASGVVARTIDKFGKGPLGLAVLMVVMGMLFAIPVFSAPTAPQPRAANVPNMEAMTHAQTPLWVALLNPLLSAVGVVAGAKVKEK